MCSILARRILHVTADGIRYEDQAGNEEYIDFNSANNGWRAYIAESRGLKPEEVASRGVGWRDACSRPSYIEFFCEPHVRVEFTASRVPWRRGAAVQAFVGLHQAIADAGWATFDLS